MSVLRQLNILGQMRIDVPHLRSIESSIAADFDVVAGRVQAGEKAVVIRGFALANFTSGTAASSVQLSTADGIVYNMSASEAGTFLWVPADRAVETLNSATNARVSGSFTAGQVNYVGLDFTRAADATTADLVQFLDPNTLLENAKNVPLGRTLDYRIVISTTPFSSSPNLVPIAKIKTDASNNVDSATSSVQDARNILWRLGSGGDFPNRYNSFSWAQNRVESVSGAGVFVGGDKSIQSEKDWMDAVMSRIWEIGGGENWYSTTADRNVRMVRAPSPSVFATTGDNFEWVAGLYSSTHLHWQGLKIAFDNSNTSSVYYNTINDQTGDDTTSAALTSKTALADGDCLYVDIDRTANSGLTAKKASLQLLSVPSIPGSRFVFAWRIGSNVYTRDAAWPVNVAQQPATTTVVGAVRLNNTAGTPATPTIPTLDANNAITLGVGSYLIAGANTGLTVTGGSASGIGIKGIGGAVSGFGGVGVYGQGGDGYGTGVYGRGGASGAGGQFVGGPSGASGVTGSGTIGQTGVYGSSDTGVGVMGGSGSSTGFFVVGVSGFGNSTSSIAVYAQGFTASSGPDAAGAMALQAVGGDAYASASGTRAGGPGAWILGGNGNGSTNTGGDGGLGAWIVGGSAGNATHVSAFGGAGGRGATIAGGTGGNVGNAVNNPGTGGTGIYVTGGDAGLRVGGTLGGGPGGTGIITTGGIGGFPSGAGPGIVATGGVSNGTNVGSGSGGQFFGGANTVGGQGGYGIYAYGGNSSTGYGGNGIYAVGGNSSYSGAPAGHGITAYGGGNAVSFQSCYGVYGKGGTGGSTLNFGGYFEGGAGNAHALYAQPAGNGNAIIASNGGGSGYAFLSNSGDIAIQPANFYRYASAVSRAIYIPVSDFIYTTVSSGYTPLPSNTLGPLIGIGTGGSLQAGAKVRLPYGAIITSIQFLSYNDDGAARNLTVAVGHMAYNAGGAFTLTQVHTGVSGGVAVSQPLTGGLAGTETWKTVPINATLTAPADGYTFIYFVTTACVTTSKVGVYGFRVAYTTTYEAAMR